MYWANVFYKTTESARRELLWEPKLAKILNAYGLNGDLSNFNVIDVGGGFGTFAELAISQTSAKKVCVIEPNRLLSEACRNSGTPLIVDDSTACPGNIDVLRYADVVTTSLTKWISGAGDVMAGMACVREDSPYNADFSVALAGEVSECAPLYAGDSLALLANLKESSARWAMVNASGLALAEMLSAHPAVENVWHPSITNRTEYDKLRKEGGGYGGLLSMVLKAQKKTSKFYDALRFCKGPTFGIPFTIVCPYTMLAHYSELAWAEGCGVPGHLIRVSVGTEGANVICDRFRQALGEI